MLPGPTTLHAALPGRRASAGRGADRLGGMPPPPPPRWFTEALAAPGTERHVEAHGARIHVLDWGPHPGAPGLVFVHGGAAHAHWWSFLAPMLAGRWHPVAFDLSGHGDSGRRSHYSHETWAAEVMAVADSAGVPGP
ncbi:MAG: alpha/beta fold hydrolase, partial [Actinobacteria bacterium]|nr:alpha/beta fold hydrolase [Actinomycetota bacterium]